jgi:hypothetical protein
MKVLNNYKQQVDGTVILTREDVETISMALGLACMELGEATSDKLDILHNQFKAIIQPMRDYEEIEGHHEGNF